MELSSKLCKKKMIQEKQHHHRNLHCHNGRSIQITFNAIPTIVTWITIQPICGARPKRTGSCIIKNFQHCTTQIQKNPINNETRRTCNLIERNQSANRRNDNTQEDDHLDSHFWWPTSAPWPHAHTKATVERLTKPVYCF